MEYKAHQGRFMSYLDSALVAKEYAAGAGVTGLKPKAVGPGVANFGSELMFGNR